MTSLLSWLVRHPLQAAIITGLLVAIVFGLISFPNEDRIHKTVRDWLPANASSDAQVTDNLIRSLDAARDDEEKLVQVSEDEFQDLRLPVADGVVEADKGETGFVIRHVGKESLEDEKVYTSERRIDAGPWWSPDRLIYRTLRAETDQFGDVLTLTFERDWEGLLGLLLVDVIVGTVYGTLVGLILSVFGTKTLEAPGFASTQKRLPPETPISAIKSGERV